MKTKELIEELKWVMDTEGKVYQEIIEKLRQLEDVKRMLHEMWDLSSQRDDIQWDLNKILED